MEPTDLNSPSDADRRLEALLRQAQPELPDHGFSTRVLAALPREKTVGRMPSRLMLCTIGSVAGAVFAVGHGITPSELDAAADRLNESLASVAPLATNPGLLAALAITGASLLFAFRTGDRRALF